MWCPATALSQSPPPTPPGMRTALPPVGGCSQAGAVPKRDGSGLLLRPVWVDDAAGNQEPRCAHKTGWGSRCGGKPVLAAAHVHPGGCGFRARSPLLCLLQPAAPLTLQRCRKHMPLPPADPPPPSHRRSPQAASPCCRCLGWPACPCGSPPGAPCCSPRCSSHRPGRRRSGSAWGHGGVEEGKSVHAAHRHQVGLLINENDS